MSTFVPALAIAILLPVAANAQESLWTDLAERPAATDKAAARRAPQGSGSREVALDLTGMIAYLAGAKAEVARGRGALPGAELRVDLPHPDGGFEAFRVYSTNIMAPELAARYPEIRTFAGESMRDPAVRLRLDYTPAGLHAQVLGPGIRWHIDPLSRSTRTQYASFHAARALQSGTEFRCLVEGQPDAPASRIAPGYQQRTQSRSAGDILRTYRLAVATTGEYGQFHGGTKPLALAAIVTTINRVDGIYQQELAIAFTLVANNDAIVYVDPLTDPFSGNNSANILINESQVEIDSKIGSANYDIGHTFSTGAGGLASLGVICNGSFKARGVTGRSNPIGDPFDVDFVAHEIGHQFGGSHTFNGANGSCSGGNRNGPTAYEPGSGSTIQAYAGICGADNLQSSSDPIFHSESFDQMIAHVTVGSGAACDATSSLGNAIPTVDAGADYTIPRDTPFLLTGAADDSDGDTLTYLWEQRDLGTQQPLTAADDGAIPLFRVYTPTTSPTRFLPRLSTLAAGASSTSEKLPTQSRAMDWRLTARDGNGGVNSDDMVVNVDAATGPFTLLSPNGGETASESVTVTWDVAGTSGAPVNAAQVNFYLSTDSGQSFDLTTPLGATLNDGSATVSLPPALSSSTVRLMVRAENNIFFDISDLDFTVAPAGSLPGAPVISSATPGSGTATLAFIPGAEGASPTTSFTATCDAGSAGSASGVASPGLLIDGSEVVMSSINIPDSGVIAAIDAMTIDMNITHTWRGDVQLDLRSPSGTTIDLWGTNENDSLEDVIGTFPSTLTPAESLNAFMGESITGNWTLSVTDIFPSLDDGTLNSWAIHIDYASAGSTSGGSSPLLVGGLADGTTYACQVFASNASGDSPVSAAFNVTPGATPPAQPVITGIEPGDSSLLVNFTSGAAGTHPIVGYVVNCDGQLASGSASPIAVIGLNNDTAYSCSVIAYSDAGTSQASSPLQATPEGSLSRLNIILIKAAVDARNND